jgi:hypothetical protein
MSKAGANPLSEIKPYAPLLTRFLPIEPGNHTRSGLRSLDAYGIAAMLRSAAFVHCVSMAWWAAADWLFVARAGRLPTLLSSITAIAAAAGSAHRCRSDHPNNPPAPLH